VAAPLQIVIDAFMAANAAGPLVPGRECGSCTACCVHLLVHSRDFTKLQGVACPNCELGHGCKIYEIRPQVCHSFMCGWRTMPMLDESWRPDRSGVIVQVTQAAARPPEYYFVLFGPKYVLMQSKFAAVIGQLIAEGRQTYLALPGNQHELSMTVYLNAGLSAAVARRDLAAICAGLVQAYDTAMNAPREKLDLAKLPFTS